MQENVLPDKMDSLILEVTPTRWLAGKALGRLRPKLCLSKLGGLRLRSAPVPSLPADDWVLCRTLLGGVCGTDLGMVFMRQHPGTLLRKFISQPIFMGHENVARIERTGPAATDFRPGQRVLVDPPIACAARKITPPCPSCREGHPSVCWNTDRGDLPPAIGLGYNNFTGGSWSPYFSAHVSQIHVLPDDIPDEQAILIDPIACSLHAVLRDLPAPDEKILVVGAGIIGLGAILALRALNLPVHITAADRAHAPANMAAQCGADHAVVLSPKQTDATLLELAELTGARYHQIFYKMRFFQGGFDRVYDCTGKPATLVEFQRLVRPGAKYVIAGTPQLGLMDLTCFWFRELNVLGATGRAVETLPGQPAPQHNYRHIIDLIQQKRLDLSTLKVQLHRQNDYHAALTARRPPAIKSAFDFR